MNQIPRFGDLNDLYSQIKELIRREGNQKTDEKPPSDFEDVQDQIRAVPTCEAKAMHLVKKDRQVAPPKTWADLMSRIMKKKTELRQKAV